MRLFVINLPGDADRRANAAKQLDAAGVGFQFFEAIRGGDVSRRCPFDGCDEQEFLVNTGRHVSSAEIGCFASHRALWKQAASLDEPIVVMEDDFALRENFAAAVRDAARIIDRAGFLRLQKDLRAHKRVLAARNGFVVCRYTKAPHGSMCYCISPAVARRFLSLTKTMDAPVDVFIKKFWEHGQPLYALTPYPVVSSLQSTESTIGRPSKRKKPFPVAARRLLRKTGWQFRRLRFNLRRRVRPADPGFAERPPETAIQPGSSPL